MRLKLACVPLLTVPWRLASAQMVTYQGFSNTLTCTGSHFQCTDGGAVCCSFPTGFGYSVQFIDLPPGTQGQGYTGGRCADFLFAVFGPGTKCWNGGGMGATNMNWFHSPPRSRRDGTTHASNVSESNTRDKCTFPSAFSYQDAHGELKTIDIPQSEGAAEIVAQLYFSNNLTSESLSQHDGFTDHAYMDAWEAGLW